MSEYALTVLRGQEPPHAIEGDTQTLASLIEQYQAQECQGLAMPDQRSRLHSGEYVDGQQGLYAGIWFEAPDEPELVEAVGTCSHLRFAVEDRWWGLVLFACAVLPLVAARLTTRLQARFKVVSLSLEPVALPTGRKAAGWLQCGGDVPLDTEMCLAELRATDTPLWRLPAPITWQIHAALPDLRTSIAAAWHSQGKIDISSDVSLARIVIQGLGGANALAGSDDDLWCCSGAASWRLVSPLLLKFAVTALDGLSVGSGSEERPFSLTARRVSDVATMVKVLSPALGLGDGPGGIAFGSRLFYVAGDKLAEKPLELGDRVPADHVLPWPFVEDAQDFQDRSEFVALLREGWASEDDADVLLDFLLAWLGLTLLGVAHRFGKHPVLVGSCASARRDLVTAIESCFPPRARCNLAPHEIGQRFKPDRLRDKLLNVTTDMATRDLKEASRLKAVLSGSGIDAEAKSKDGYSLYARAGHLFSGDELFQIADPGLRGMLWLLPFSLDEAPADPARAARLSAEAPLITSLAIGAARKVLARGAYVRPKSSVSEALDWLADSDPLLAWMRLNLEKSPDGRMASDEIMGRFNTDHPQAPDAATRNNVAARLRKLKYRKAPRKNNLNRWKAVWKPAPGQK